MYLVWSVLCLLIVILELVSTSPFPSNSLNFCTKSVGYRIIGGRSTSIVTWPWQALFFNLQPTTTSSIFSTTQYGTMCGATVLNEKWALTAAHCVIDAGSQSYVNVGVTSIEKAKKTLRVDRIVIHPSFNMETVRNDIALIKVKGKIPLSGSISPVCIAEDDYALLKYNKYGNVTGFGLSLQALGPSVFSLEKATSLQVTAVPFIDTKQCAKRWSSMTGGTVHIDPSKYLCAGSRLHGTAPGDSGGPLHVLDASTGNSVQVGITSFGANGDEGLLDQASYPGVYTRVSAFVPWIQRVINENSSTSFFRPFPSLSLLISYVLLR